MDWKKLLMNCGIEMYGYKNVPLTKNSYFKSFLFFSIALFLCCICVQKCFVQLARLVMAYSSISFIYM